MVLLDFLCIFMYLLSVFCIFRVLTHKIIFYKILKVYMFVWALPEDLENNEYYARGRGF